MRLEAVTYEAAGVRTQHPAVGAVIKIGMLPNSEWCGDAVDRDAEGYVRVDTHGRTTLPLVWASGDVTRPVLPSIATAIGSAAAALADIRVVLEGVSGP